MRGSAKTAMALAAAAALLGPAAAQQAPPPAPLVGFLNPEAYPDALALLPAPPAQGTPAEAADQSAYTSTRRLEGSARWRQAVADVELRSEAAFAGWSCAAGVHISGQTTPATAALLRRTLADAGLAANAAKDHYDRPRPFLGNDAPICVTRESLATSGSYPSGHASVGWAWALILAELKPDRADAILQRGREFGDSRVVCGVHYPSDVEAGRLIGAAVVARLHAEEQFEAAMAEAKAELAKATVKPEGCGS